MKRLIWLAFLLVVACSSGQRNYFAGKSIMKDNAWNRFNFLVFELPVEKPILLDIFLDVEFADDYPWDDIKVNITFYTPDGDYRSADYSFDVLKDKGQKSGSTTIQFPVIKMMSFSAPGVHEVRVENKMPKVQAPGIKMVGLTALESKR